MTAIQDAERAMKELGERHENKTLNLFSGHVGDFWKKEDSRTMVKSMEPVSAVLPWSAYVFHDSIPVRVERFRTQEKARDFKKNRLGIALQKDAGWEAGVTKVTRNERGLKVKMACKIMHSNSQKAKELDAKLPKVRTKTREPKQQQIDMFTR